MRATRSDPVIDELGWYFTHAEEECDARFTANTCAVVPEDAPDTAFDTKSIAKARRIRNTLAAMPERWHRVLARAFEPRAFRHAWQRFGKSNDVELATLAVCTLAFRLRFEDTSNDGDHPVRHMVGAETAVWIDDHQPYERAVKIDGLEAFALSLGDKSKVTRRASRTAARMLQIALEYYRRARGDVRVKQEWRAAA